MTTYGLPAHPAELLALVALDNLGKIRERARTLLDTNRPLINQFLAQHPDLDCEPSRFGTTIFPRLRTGNAAEFVAMLREQFETGVVPGGFFEAPQHFRMGLCGTTDSLRNGLERMDAALSSFQKVSA